MKVQDCEHCEHCKRKTRVTYHTPNSYHAIGITHAYAYCERYKKRVSEVKICEPMGERMNKEQAFFEAQLMFGKTIKELKEQVAELRKQLREWQDGTIICKWTNAENKLKSQPAEIVEKIKQEIEKEKDENDLAWLGFKRLNRILDNVLLEYQK